MLRPKATGMKTQTRSRYPFVEVSQRSRNMQGAGCASTVHPNFSLRMFRNAACSSMDVALSLEHTYVGADIQAGTMIREEQSREWHL